MPKYPNGGTKYTVGHVFENGKRLTKHMGSHPKWKTSYWMWACNKCGKEAGPSLINSITRMDRRPSCCFKYRAGAANPNWSGYEGLTGVWLGQRLTDATKRGYEWSVTPEFLWKLWLDQHGKCWYTGQDLTLYVNVNQRGNASLDRTDNTKGYVEGNVRWVHTRVNQVKSNLPEDDFLRLCSAVAEHSTGRI